MVINEYILKFEKMTYDDSLWMKPTDESPKAHNYLRIQFHLHLPYLIDRHLHLHPNQTISLFFPDCFSPLPMLIFFRIHSVRGIIL